MNFYFVFVNIYCVIDNNLRIDFDVVSCVWKVGEGVWVLSCDVDYNRVSLVVI